MSQNDSPDKRDTPRTEAVLFEQRASEEAVPADFARQLERELALAQIAARHLEREYVAAANPPSAIQDKNRILCPFCNPLLNGNDANNATPQESRLLASAGSEKPAVSPAGAAPIVPSSVRECHLPRERVERLFASFALLAAKRGWKQSSLADIATLQDWTISTLESATRPRFALPTPAEIAAYKDRFRAELNRRMDTSHPSSSPSTEAHAVALCAFVEGRNRLDSTTRDK